MKNVYIHLQKQSPWRCSLKKLFLKVRKFHRKMAHVFSYEFCEMFEKTFFHRTPPVAVSALTKVP